MASAGLKHQANTKPDSSAMLCWWFGHSQPMIQIHNRSYKDIPVLWWELMLEWEGRASLLAQVEVGKVEMGLPLL